MGVSVSYLSYIALVCILLIIGGVIKMLVKGADKATAVITVVASLGLIAEQLVFALTH